MYSSLKDVVTFGAQQNPDKYIYHYLNNDLTIVKSISVKELQEVAGAVAGYINKNIKQGERILLFFENSPEFIFAFFGVIYSHAIPVCVDSSRRNLKKHLRYYMEDMNASHMLALQNMKEKILSFLPANHEINLHIFENLLITNNRGIVNSDQKPEDTCFIQYTSGSTGRPKGVVISNLNILSNSEQIKCAFGANEESIGLSWLPHFHDMGLVGGLIQPLFSNFPVYIMSHKHFSSRPNDWLKAISKFRVSITGGPNIAYDYLKRKNNNIKEDLDLSCWHVAFIGADFVSAETMHGFSKQMKRFKFEANSLTPCYGMAEATLMVCSHERGESITTYHCDHYVNTNIQKLKYFIREDAVCCGKVNEFTDIIIVNENKICNAGELGEIYISGKSVTRKYWNQEIESFDFFSPSNRKYNSYVKTGDIGVLVDNKLFILGRSKELLIINGINISPVDIEQDIQKINKHLLAGRGVVYQETSDSINLIQEVEKVSNIDWHVISRCIRLNVYKKFNLIINKIEFVKRGSIATTSSGKLIRSNYSNISQSATIFKEMTTKHRGIIYG